MHSYQAMALNERLPYSNEAVTHIVLFVLPIVAVRCAVTDHGCAHICADLAVGYECRCRPGFQLNTDLRTCSRKDHLNTTPELSLPASVLSFLRALIFDLVPACFFFDCFFISCAFCLIFLVPDI